MRLNTLTAAVAAVAVYACGSFAPAALDTYLRITDRDGSRDFTGPSRADGHVGDIEVGSWAIALNLSTTTTGSGTTTGRPTVSPLDFVTPTGAYTGPMISALLTGTALDSVSLMVDTTTGGGSAVARPLFSYTFSNALLTNIGFSSGDESTDQKNTLGVFQTLTYKYFSYSLDTGKLTGTQTLVFDLARNTTTYNVSGTVGPFALTTSGGGLDVPTGIASPGTPEPMALSALALGGVMLGRRRRA